MDGGYITYRRVIDCAKTIMTSEATVPVLLCWQVINDF